ncbi:hypothetical protein CH372_18890, partial [Leptospira meyeri]|uniref:hypothetical protein n=1 Tax=Leptospira meyeri TaxID=29508 RepID=UPI000CC9B830
LLFFPITTALSAPIFPKSIPYSKYTDSRKGFPLLSLAQGNESNLAFIGISDKCRKYCRLYALR